MREEAFEELVKDFDRKEELIESGDLPDDEHLFPRFVYAGHDVVHTYGNYGPAAKYRCVTCKIDFNGREPEADGGGVVRFWNSDCPTCLSDAEVYQININRSARWRCTECKHEWDGEDGEECPSCNSPPNYKKEKGK